MQTTSRTSRKYLATPIAGVLGGVVYLVAFSVAGQPLFGVLALALMAAFSLVLVLARRRSETVRGLMDHRDERISAIDLRATAVTALVMIGVVFGGFVVEVARGRSGWPYDMIGAVAGVSYIAAVVWLRIRG